MSGSAAQASQLPSSAPCARSPCRPVAYTTRAERILHATATPDGSAVIVTDPHPAFAAAVRDLQR
ncbi:hypothetical protein GS426_07575 [Rhodococcus hoagii]|nr:hypothetical protein [Prescottella equi]